jgi:ankyrin repeat protein
MMLDYFIGIKRLSEVEKLLARGYTTTVDFTTGKLFIRNRYYSLAMLLIQHDILAYDAHDVNGYTLLHESASKGHEGLLRLLAKKGIDINSVAYDNVSALHFPAHFGYDLTVGILLQLGINPNIQATFESNSIHWNKRTPLHIASQNGHEDIVKALITNGANKTIHDGNGQTAYQLAKTPSIQTLLQD